MEGIILSHTRMGNRGFCTNILTWDEDNKPVQIRPRLSPNKNLFVSSFGLDESKMNKFWKPGVKIIFKGFKLVQVQDRRPTHPEDCILFFDEKSGLNGTNIITGDAFVKLVEPFTFASLEELFLGYDTTYNGAAFMVPGQQLDQSVGYVWCRFAELYSGYGSQQRIRVVDRVGNEINAPLKDFYMLERIKYAALDEDSWQDVLVRFSLAEAWKPRDASPNEEERCYIMASHIVL